MSKLVAHRKNKLGKLEAVNGQPEGQRERFVGKGAAL